MPLFPLTSYISLAFLAFVIGLMAYNPDTRIALVIGPLFLVFLVVVYYAKGFHKRGTVQNNAEERVS